MAAMTYDGQSLLIEGRRVWVVSGALCPARIARGEWAARVRDARLAGLNTIEVPVVWSRHEPWAGKFDFDTGQNDLPAFIRTIADEGLHCILRVGPYVGAGFDLGGIPAWLLEDGGPPLRGDDERWLAAASKFLGELAKRVADLQKTAANAGPILLAQIEHEWLCADEVRGQTYFHALHRALRENGLTVPIINRNNLYHGLEDEIDGWTDHQHLHTVMRQLRAVRPGRPRFVLGAAPDGVATWTDEASHGGEPADLARRLVETLAGGGQFNLDPFHAGSYFAFDAGRVDEREDGFIRTNGSLGGAIMEDPQAPGPIHAAARRVCLFASNFERVLANLDPDWRPVAVAPGEGSVTALHCRGRQGSVVFLIGPAHPNVKQRSTALVLEDGRRLPVEVGDLGVGWVVLDAHLFDRTTLDYTNLNACAIVGRTVLMFGRAGAHASLSINRSPLECEVPRGREALIEEHEGATLVICNDELIDATVVDRDAIYLGATRIDDAGRVTPVGRSRTVTRIDESGAVTKVKATASKTATPPTLKKWSVADAGAQIDGSSERFARIDGPRSMVALGQSQGYGWLRATWKSGANRSVPCTIPGAADRLHLYLDGDSLGLIGEGPGVEASDTLTIPMRRGDQSMTILVDQLGRFCDGIDLRRPSGVPGDVVELASVRVGAPKVEEGASVALLDVRSPLFPVDHHDQTHPGRLTWRVKHHKQTPLYMDLPALHCMAALILNDEPHDVITTGRARRLAIDAEALKRGDNVIQLALLDGPDAMSAAERKSVRFHAVKNVVSEKWTWSYAVWETPAEESFESLPGDAGGRKLAKWKGRPAWWRASFDATDADALHFDATGLSKGQILLNGQNLCRYFVATPDGKPMTGQIRYRLPGSCLRDDGPNELLIFDEHGFPPHRTSLVASP